MIIEKLNKHILETKEERDKTAISPTDANQCPRKTYYSFIKAPAEPFTAKELLIFSMGESIHLRLQKYLQDSKLQLQAERRIEDFYKTMPIHAYIDSICIIDNEPYIIELKSHKDWNYGNKCYLNEPKEEHIGQIQMYMHFTGIKKGIILYENKNTSELKEFEVLYDPEYTIKVLDELFLIWEQYQNKIEPNRNPEYQLSKYPCFYCKFVKHCFRDINLD
jgi:hypothetical protein